MTNAALPDPLLMRVFYEGQNTGATAFFRNRPFLKTIIEALKSLDRKPVTAFFHACSVGAEPYSFVAGALENDLEVQVEATDLEPEFLATAVKGAYPPEVVNGMSRSERRWFHVLDKAARVDAKLKERIRFLPPQSLLDPISGLYDVVFAMNVLTYLTPEEQTRAIATIAKAAHFYLCVTAFHPDTIKSDMEAVGFEPVMENQEDIHNSWGDRVQTGSADPGTTAYSWKVPRYNTDASDYAWRYCAIFKRKAA